LLDGRSIDAELSRDLTHARPSKRLQSSWMRSRSSGAMRGRQ
jgi:hypothetical protein